MINARYFFILPYWFVKRCKVTPTLWKNQGKGLNNWCLRTQSVDLRQEEGCFEHFTGLKSCGNEKIAVPLHRQKTKG
jgi:hypothetical protein